MSVTTEPTLRQRTRDRMRQEVVAVALRLFAERGFDAVTTTQIAAAAGISPRSFFRYFPAKEDVVLAGLRDTAVRVRDAFETRPPDEPVWDSLRLAFRHLVADENAGIAGVADIVVSTASIQMRSADKRQDWEDVLVPSIAARLRPGDDAEDRARAVLSAGLACLDTTTRVWLSGDRTTDPIATLDALMGQFRLE